MDYVTYITEAYSEPCQTSKSEYFAKINNDQKPLTIFTKCSILDVCRGSQYTSAFYCLVHENKGLVSF